MHDTSPRAPLIDPAWTVNEVVRRQPATMGVFRVFGIDACCGGAYPVSEAARRHNADPDALVAALEAAAGEEGWPLLAAAITPSREAR